MRSSDPRDSCVVDVISGFVGNFSTVPASATTSANGRTHLR